MEVTQVKRLNDQTTILWTTPNGRYVENHDLTNCPDVPHVEFLDILATVEADLVAKAGLGVRFGNAFTLTGIAMSRNAAGRRQFVPSMKLDFGWGETGASMSLLLEPDAENKRTTGANVLTDFELKNIEQLLEEGADYTRGTRHQIELELDEAG